jgi:hypothetical protein
LAAGPREPADNEVVGIFDHVFDHPVGYGSVDDHGVPVAFVEVVPRKHGRMSVAELLCEQWFALDAELKRALREPGEREHLAGHLEHGGLGTKWERLGGPGKRKTMIA